MLLLLTTALALAEPEMIPLDVFEAAAKSASVTGDFEIPLRGGGSFKLSDHKGKPVLLTFWASWCSPCRKELPALELWSKSHPDVVVLAVNVDRGAALAEKFLAAVHFDLPVAFDPDATHLGRYGVTSMPTMFLFHKGGQLVWRHSGYGEEKGFTELDSALLDSALGGAK